ncbi:hypothetical protein N8H70_09720 [Klebsiella quasipneumoniae]|uniref:hypothetical protein n=1 Tax=Klebsiella quasipneumoniae TaxID=1463165 RepID=UPI002366CB7F|nr:hypothetical protein [Klebsiella quasipneumoniae]HCD6353366.1 hypothetical protein [Klebsiella variicola]MDD7845117.1 hypothetical protein [Klebsiella quasipneumoniae]MDD7860077.1 hypothetical protein [Klebsiella quasipneumoniae]MDF8306657.1 hypothetical protein [Klebsiella quasipneumoniae]HDK6336075.1 hypothetical protein [Klebsiella quasipneumoniae]
MNNDGLTLNQLAERNAVLVTEVEKLRAERDQLAAENVALKQFPEQIVQFIGGLGTSEIGIDTKEKIGLAAIRIKTPATDRIVAGIKADGVEMFALMFAEEAIKDNNITTGWKARASRAASEYAELLREGAK